MRGVVVPSVESVLAFSAEHMLDRVWTSGLEIATVGSSGALVLETQVTLRATESPIRDTL